MEKVRETDIAWFTEKAILYHWGEFDKRVLEVCEDESWLNWTTIGLKSEVESERDLAISILEKTKSSLGGKKVNQLNEVIASDENPHLRSKAAITLYRHNVRNEMVLAQLEEAKLNDDELRKEVLELSREDIK